MSTPPTPQQAQDYNRRLGLILFALYCLIYAGFIGLAVLSQKTLASPALFGVNLAVTYGMALIAFAGVFAAVYLWMAKSDTDGTDGTDHSGKGH